MSLAYDPLNRLDTYNPGSSRRFIYDGNQIAAEVDSAGTIVGRYVFADGPDEVVATYSTSSTSSRSWVHADERGSVIALSGSTGAATQKNKYDEYGNPQFTNAGRFQYTGQAWLPEIKLYYYKARMYWPTAGGRFVQTDPIGPEDDPNLYAYVGNDPVNNVDPMGLADLETIYVTRRINPNECTGCSMGATLLAGAINGPGPVERNNHSGAGGSNAPIVITKKRTHPAPPPRPSPSIIPIPTVSQPPPMILAAAAQRQDYCGSTGTEAVPDRVGGTDITGPCANHDACYASLTDREQCDRQLMFDIWEECRRHSNTVACYAAGPIYYWMLRALGRPAYRRAH